MTREQATELVEDLIQAHYDYETIGRASYRDHYRALKQSVINFLTDEHTPKETGTGPASAKINYKC